MAGTWPSCSSPKEYEVYGLPPRVSTTRSERLSKQEIPDVRLIDGNLTDQVSLDLSAPAGTRYGTKVYNLGAQ